MWRVVLDGKDSTMQYVYHVTAGAAATLNMIEISAYRQHGKLFARGVVAELAALTPAEVTFIGKK